MPGETDKNSLKKTYKKNKADMVDYDKLWDASITAREKFKILFKTISFDPDNKKSPFQVKKENAYLRDKIIEEEFDKLVDYMSDKSPEGEKTFKNFFENLAKNARYGKKNQQLIIAQKPNSTGVAPFGEWEKLGYTAKGKTEPAFIEEAYTHILVQHEDVKKWLDNNPLISVVQWFNKLKKRTEIKENSLAEYLMEKVDGAVNHPELRGLKKEIERYVESYVFYSERPDKNKEDEETGGWKKYTQKPVQVLDKDSLIDPDGKAEFQNIKPLVKKQALEMYIKRFTEPVLPGLSYNKPDKRLEAQVDSLEQGRFSIPPFKAGSKLVRALAVIYFDKINTEWKKSSGSELKTAGKNLIKAFEKNYFYWQNVVNMKKELSNTKGFTNSFLVRQRHIPVFALEDVEPDPKKEKIYMFQPRTECNEEVYSLVKNCFQRELTIEEIEDEIPESLSVSSVDNTVFLSKKWSPEKRLILLVREWAGRQCEKTEVRKEIFNVSKEMYAHAILSSIGMDNPYTKTIQLNELDKKDIKDCINGAYYALLEKTRIIESIQNAIKDIVEKEQAKTVKNLLRSESNEMDLLIKETKDNSSEDQKKNSSFLELDSFII